VCVNTLSERSPYRVKRQTAACHLDKSTGVQISRCKSRQAEVMTVAKWPSLSRDESYISQCHSLFAIGAAPSISRSH
jgi:hypothetical protein